jgi:prepilin-type N-terminal cleavage/methylation domain-containing protein/prepilin-type processing-associated H-X9-DG protein
MATAADSKLARDLLRRSRPRGFTLIEMLVVIAIIAILAAILFPVYARVRDSARRIRCMSNVKQIATATIMYTADWGLYPWQGSPSQPRVPIGDGDFTALVELAHEYVRGPKIFRCPGDRTEVDEITNGILNETNSARASYDTAFSVLRKPPKEEHGDPLAISEGYVKDPSSFPMWWDYRGGTTPAMVQAMGYAILENTNHRSRGGNVAYADGHAKWLPSEQWDNESRPINAPGNRPPGISDRLMY